MKKGPDHHSEDLEERQQENTVTITELKRPLNGTIQNSFKADFVPAWPQNNCASTDTLPILRTSDKCLLDHTRPLTKLALKHLMKYLSGDNTGFSLQQLWGQNSANKL